MLCSKKIFVIGDCLESKALGHSLSLLTDVEHISATSLAESLCRFSNQNQAVILLSDEGRIGEVWKQLTVLRIKHQWMGRLIIISEANQKAHFDENVFVRLQSRTYPAHGFLPKPVQIGLLLQSMNGLTSYRRHGFDAYLKLIDANVRFGELVAAWDTLHTPVCKRQGQHKAALLVSRMLLKMQPSVQDCLMSHAEQKQMKKWVSAEGAMERDWMNTLENIIARLR